LGGPGIVGAYGLTGTTDVALAPDGLHQATGGTLCQTRNSSQTVIRRDLAEGEYNVSTSQKLLYMPDQLGSVRDVLDGTTGNLVQSYDYTPYGAVARSNGATSMDYKYAELFAHVASGLNLSGTRAQDGNTGRWINRDLMSELGGLNLYAYVRANPAMLTDRMGFGNFVGFPSPTGGGNYMAPQVPPGNFPPPPTDPLLTQSQVVAILETVAAASTVGGVYSYINIATPWGDAIFITGVCAEGLKQLLDPTSEFYYAVSNALTYGPKALGAEGTGVTIDLFKLTIKILH
jgi:RHS repeat-associated protein